MPFICLNLSQAIFSVQKSTQFFPCSLYTKSIIFTPLQKPVSDVEVFSKINSIVSCTGISVVMRDLLFQFEQSIS